MKPENIDAADSAVIGETSIQDGYSFPYQVITGHAENYVHEYSSRMESPPEFFYMSYLTFLGVAVADRLSIETELNTEPRLYTLLLGESADDRKTTAIVKTKQLLRDMVHCCEGVGSAEGLQKQMEKHPNLLLFYDEFRHFISKAQIQGSVLLDCVGSLFESTTYEGHTRDNDMVISDGHLAMLAASTIETYMHTWDSNFTDIGMNNRLFIVPGSSTKLVPLPERVPVDVKRRIMANFSATVAFVGNMLCLPFTDDARALFSRWYTGLVRGKHTKRLDTIALRLMALIAINDMQAVIDTTVVQKALMLSDWQLKMRETYDPIDADNQGARNEEIIRRQLKKHQHMTLRDLKIYCHASRMGLDCFKRALNNMVMSGEVAHKNKEYIIVS